MSIFIINHHMTGDTPIKASGEKCPCGTKKKFKRVARCDESTDGMNLHYDICPTCGFETYAHNKMAVKIERYNKWKDSGIKD